MQIYSSENIFKFTDEKFFYLSPPIIYKADLNNILEYRKFFEHEEENSVSERSIFSIPDYSGKEDNLVSNNHEVKSTNLETNLNNNENENENENSTSNICSFEKIKSILLTANNTDDFKNLMNNIKIDEKLKEVEENMKLVSRKKIKPIKIVESQKRGRKKLSDKKERIGGHNKFSADNIIKKLKGAFLKIVIKYINDIFNLKKNGLVILNYKNSINQIKRDNDLNILSMPIKDLLSQEITSKFKHKSKDWNKRLIESILNGNKGNDDREFNNFVLNMKYIDWINIYTTQKNINDFDIKESWKEKIKSKMPNIKELLTKIRNKEGNRYLSYFSLYLFNYKNWFANKKGRNRNQKSYK